ncbi:alpha-L-fucosidase [Neobacillus sp. M.A.Huq-85]
MKNIDWPQNYGDPSWFLHDRFGMFIHFGLYTLPSRHEWVMTREQIHPEKYKKYFHLFNPESNCPDEWALKAEQAGMKYVVLTTKHHEGFVLWDSQYTDYKVTNTPYGKDLLKEFVDAFRKRGLKIGFYYSLIDWYHPHFTIDGLHPLREDRPEELNQRDFSKYAAYLHNQVEELLTGYGKIDYLWFDFSYPDRDWGWSKGKGAGDWKSEELEKLVLTLQPDIILNNRLDLQRGIQTPEQYQPKAPLTKNGKMVVWEACQTLNGSWGYDRDNLNWKSEEMIIKMLIDTVSKNGNLLLNIGPNGKGVFETKAVQLLDSLQNWMKNHAQSIYGARESGFKAPVDCRLTQKRKRLYIHVFSWPYRTIHLETDGNKVEVEYARFMHDHSEVEFKVQEETGDGIFHHDVPIIESGEIVFLLPTQKPETIVPVIEVFLK